jgi:hypothetical protein
MVMQSMQLTVSQVLQQGTEPFTSSGQTKYTVSSYSANVNM